MKKLYTITLFLAAAFIQNVSAQKAKYVNFTYNRTPLTNLASQGITNYQVSVDVAYADRVAQERMRYDALRQQEQDRYNLALEQYNQKSVAERLLLGIEAPILNIPQMPAFEFLYDGERLAQLVGIQGLNNEESNALAIDFTLDGFDKNAPVLKEKKKTRKVDGVSQEYKVYYYTASARHPVRMVIKNPNGAVITNNYINGSSGYKTVSGEENENKLRAFVNYENAIKRYQESVATNHIMAANRALNSEYGTMIVEHRAKLYTDKSTRKKDYSDLDNAIVIASVGFSNIESNPNEAISKMNEAIAIWKSAEAEYKPKAKKPRVDRKLAIALAENIIIGAIFTADWNTAQLYLTKMNLHKLNGSDKSDYARLKALNESMKQRYDAQFK